MPAHVVGEEGTFNFSALLTKNCDVSFFWTLLL